LASSGCSIKAIREIENSWISEWSNDALFPYYFALLKPLQPEGTDVKGSLAAGDQLGQDAAHGRRLLEIALGIDPVLRVSGQEEIAILPEINLYRR